MTLLMSLIVLHIRPSDAERYSSRMMILDNLPSDVTVVEIQNLFCPYGTVDSVHLIKDQETGRLRGFGFVEMMSGANEAIAALNDHELGGSRLKVRYPVKGRQEHPPRSHPLLVTPLT
jgi:RNA recognition motif-containing protein